MVSLLETCLSLTFDVQIAPLFIGALIKALDIHWYNRVDQHLGIYFLKVPPLSFLPMW